MRKTIIILFISVFAFTSVLLLAHGFDSEKDDKLSSLSEEEISLELTVVESNKYDYHVLAVDSDGRNYILNFRMLNIGRVEFIPGETLLINGYLMGMGFESIEGITVTNMVKDGNEYKLGRFGPDRYGFGHCH